MDQYDKEKENLADDGKYHLGKVFVKDGKFHYATIANGKPVMLIIKSIHLNNVEFDLHEESDGTNRLFELTPAFHDLINKNSATIKVSNN